MTNFTVDPWRDIAEHWAYLCLRELGEQGLFLGYPDQTFRPDNLMTRAEFAAAVRNAFPNTPVVREAIQFSDVPSNYWAFEAIRWTTQRGFLAGYPNQVFKPQNNISRVQALIALVNPLNLETKPEILDALLQIFQDASEIPNYARSRLAIALEKRMIVTPADRNSLKPNQPATRAEVAVFMAQASLKPGQIDRVDSQYIVEPPVILNYPVSTPWKKHKLDRSLSESARRIKFSGDEQTLASYIEEKGIQLWNIITGEKLELIVEGSQQKFGDFALSPDGKTLAVLLYNFNDKSLVLKLIDRRNNLSQIFQGLTIPENLDLENSFLSLLEFSPNGEMLASCVQTDRIELEAPWQIQLWNVSQGMVFQTLTLISETVSKLVWSPDNQKLASYATFYSTISQAAVWNIATGEQIYLTTEDSLISDIVFSPDSQILLSSVPQSIQGWPISHEVRVWDVQTGKLRSRVQISIDRTSFNRILSPDGNTIFAAGEVEGANFFEILTGASFSLEFPPNSPGIVYQSRQILFSPKGHVLGAVTPEKIFIWRVLNSSLNS